MRSTTLEMPRLVISAAHASRSGLKPRVGPYCSTDPSEPSNSDAAISANADHGNASSAG